MHEAKLKKMEMEMKMVFQQKVQEKEQKLKQSEEELYARHREMKEALEKQRLELEDKKRRIESGRPLTPEKGSVSLGAFRQADSLRKSGSVLASNHRLSTPHSLSSTPRLCVSNLAILACALTRSSPPHLQYTPGLPATNPIAPNDPYSITYELAQLAGRNAHNVMMDGFVWLRGVCVAAAGRALRMGAHGRT